MRIGTQVLASVSVSPHVEETVSRYLSSFALPSLYLLGERLSGVARNPFALIFCLT